MPRGPTSSGVMPFWHCLPNAGCSPSRRPTREHAETLPPALPPLIDGACWRSSPGTGAGHWQWRSGVTRPERPCASWKRPCGYRTSAPRSPYRRTSEAAARELAWQGAQEDRLVAEADRLADVLGSLESDATSPGAEGAPPAADSGSAEDANIGTALHAWGARARELRAQRDRLADELAEHEGRRRETE